MEIKRIDKSLLDATSEAAKANPRLRMNYNIHDDLDDPINRLINAMEPGTYVCPHRHTDPPKTEACVVLRGSLDVLIFDDEGNVLQRETLNPGKGVYGIDIPAGIWHGLIIREPGTVVYEVKTGPYTPVPETDLAPWAPTVDDAEGIRAFLASLS